MYLYFPSCLKFLCRMIFTLWDVKCTFFLCFYSPTKKTLTSSFWKSITVVLWEPFIVLSWNDNNKKKHLEQRAGIPRALVKWCQIWQNTAYFWLFQGKNDSNHNQIWKACTPPDTPAYPRLLCYMLSLCKTLLFKYWAKKPRSCDHYFWSFNFISACFLRD